MNILQFAVFFPQWSLNYPEIAKTFLKNVKIIALMEFIPTDDLTDAISDWFGFVKCDGSNEQDCDKLTEEAIKENEENDKSLSRRMLLGDEEIEDDEDDP